MEVILKPKILCDDCRDLVSSLGKFDFIFCDPPFNIGQSHKGYSDRRKYYERFTTEWIQDCWCACDGVLALHGPDDLVEAFLISARRFEMRRIGWVNWHYPFGQCTRRNWIDARSHCLVFAKHDSWTWNPYEVLVESDRANKYNDSRIHETVNGGKRLVWGVPSDGPNWGRIQGNNRERRPGHPNQLPEACLVRLIKAYSNAGDRILDPFCGSGTTVVVAIALRRDVVTIDISKHNCESARQRLRNGTVKPLMKFLEYQ